MKKLLLMIPVIALTLVSCGRKENQPLRGLLITGNDHPAHKWKETTPAIRAILEKDSLAVITVSEDPGILKDVSIDDYDFIVLNYCNWEDPDGLSEYAKAGFVSYLRAGGGLIVLHFSNGAFNASLPGAGASDWPEYRNIVRRVWNHNGLSAHDPFGPFRVDITKEKHFITVGAVPFDTKDELYFNQEGDMSLKPLITARSKITGADEPLAWAYIYGKARVFQTLLGHGAESYEAEEFRGILRNAVKWVTKND